MAEAWTQAASQQAPAEDEREQLREQLAQERLVNAQLQDMLAASHSHDGATVSLLGHLKP